MWSPAPPTALCFTHKVLSENPERYSGRRIQGIRELLGWQPERIARRAIDAVKMGTTVATNALLERKGEPTVLAITRARRPASHRPTRTVPTSSPGYRPAGIALRAHHRGRERLRQGECCSRSTAKEDAGDLQAPYAAGNPRVAIVLMHGYRYPAA